MQNINQDSHYFLTKYCYFVRSYIDMLPRLYTGSIYLGLLKKEVIHPQLPLRMPCYDFTPVTSLAFHPINWALGLP